MANRQPNRPPPASQVPSSARQNEYFVPRDGIDREVITSDICRYLGNDALVRPGTYEAADGRVTQGYFITAYRNLTSAMIQDLKADSARWEQERRAASRTSGGGTGGTMHSPSQPNGMFMRGSNSPIGSREPRSGQPDYVSWKNSQDAYRGGGDRMDVEYSAPPPVTQPGYGGAPYGGAPPPPHGYPSQAPYPPPGQSGSAPPYGQPYGYPPNPSQYSPVPHPGAAPAPPPISQVAPVGYSQDPGYYPGGNFSASGGYPVQPSRMTPLSSAPPSRGFGVTAGPGYSEPDAFGYGGSAPMPFSSLQNPADPVYGRAPGGAYNTTTTNPPQAPSDDLGSPAGTAPPRQGYSAGPEPPFDDRQSPIPNASTPTNGTPSQIPPTGPPPARRDTDMRDRDRDLRDHRSRRPDEDRHAAERERARRRQH